MTHALAGQRLRPLSYSKSHVILIAFAIDTPDSLENVSVKVRVVSSLSLSLFLSLFISLSRSFFLFLSRSRSRSPTFLFPFTPVDRRSAEHMRSDDPYLARGM